MQQDMNGKVAWVTGAGSGIGEAAAIALAKLGMNVVLSGRREPPLADVAARIGEQALVWPMDVADKAAVARVGAEIINHFGRIDLLVNNAGINVPNRNWHAVTPEGWDSVIRIDLDGAFYCINAVLPTMRAQQDGLIINVSSYAGRYSSMLTGPAYAAAKHAMNAMNETLNMENGIHGIRACALCPGEVATPILEKRPVPVSAEEQARMLQSEDCAEIIAFIAQMPRHVCITELIVTPTWNRKFVKQAQALSGA